MNHSAATPDAVGTRRPSVAWLAAAAVGVLVLGAVFMRTGNSSSTASMTEDAVAARIQKVGSIAFVEARKDARTGEQVYQAQCGACHATGAMGSPKFADTAAWGARIGAGFDALLSSALKGKGSMPPQSGGASSDLEVARALVYMANAGGAKFPEPKDPSK